MTRYMVLTKYDEGLEAPPMAEWAPDDITALLEYVRALNQELIENGELVDGVSLAGPEAARVVVSDGGPPIVTDGPFPEVKELLAGYQIIDVESEARAIEIAGCAAPPGALSAHTPTPALTHRLQSMCRHHKRCATGRTPPASPAGTPVPALSGPRARSPD